MHAALLVRESIGRFLDRSTSETNFRTRHRLLTEKYDTRPSSGFFPVAPFVPELSEDGLNQIQALDNPIENSIDANLFGLQLDIALFQASRGRRFIRKKRGVNRIASRLKVTTDHARQLLETGKLSFQPLEELVNGFFEENFFTPEEVCSDNNVSIEEINFLLDSKAIAAIDVGLDAPVWRIPESSVSTLSLLKEQANVYTVESLANKFNIHSEIASSILSIELAQNRTVYFPLPVAKYHISNRVLSEIKARLGIAKITFGEAILTESQARDSYSLSEIWEELKERGMPSINVYPFADSPVLVYSRRDVEKFLRDNVIEVNNSQIVLEKPQQLRILMHYLNGMTIGKIKETVSFDKEIVQAVISRHNADSLLAQARRNLEKSTSQQAKAEKEIVNTYTDCLQEYLSDIDSAPLLSPEQEKEFFSHYKTGDKSAREKIFAANRRLVVYVAKHLREKLGLASSELLELIGVGNYGLNKAIDGFDVSKNNKFSTYAYSCIHNEILKQRSFSKYPFTLIGKDREQLSKLYAAKDWFVKSYGMEPNIEQLSAASRLSVKTILRLQEVYGTPLHFDSAEGFEYEDETIERQHAIDKIEALKQKLSSTLKKVLSFREYRTICLSFGIGEFRTYSLQEIADRYQFSKALVGRFFKNAKKKLQSASAREQYHLDSLVEEFIEARNFIN
ncbi:sigma-70 family RNA polymerase sigma factor [Candidatus Woesearchaeota archaeon]|nr:sigma-70 family RNA polymerase sigma factor [Candidatus Woesearchaeota archaeon]